MAYDPPLVKPTTSSHSGVDVFTVPETGQSSDPATSYARGYTSSSCPFLAVGLVYQSAYCS